MKIVIIYKLHALKKLERNVSARIVYATNSNAMCLDMGAQKTMWSYHQAQARV